ncbi:hypothetical protein Mycsm_07154 (plasmid) [Mycobacterium sp. JS623]|uniref:hypothetical protein n=1 Tax=Mycobacterium sp. JS623 TaxID=212767 RepID=UPI0002A552F8|nr:hypothetical protein [Mycobacterium sp. JS623]AGB27250.1 hypothetical protein Mycsm_07154 [Mycobacterium sp. JS623]
MDSVTTLGDGGDESVPPRDHESNSFHVVGDGGVEEVRTDGNSVDDDVVLTMPKYSESDDELDDDELNDDELNDEAPDDADPHDTTTDSARDSPPLPDDDEARHRNEEAVRLYRLVRADGFRGPRWKELVTVLAEYGLGVIEGWLITGQIYTELRDRHRGVKATGIDKHLLRTDETLRQDLADAVVTAALLKFQEETAAGRGWHEDGGAAITTFFINTCLLVFGNEFRTWQSNLGEWRDHETTADPTDIHGYTEQEPRPPEAHRDPTSEALIQLEDLNNTEAQLQLDDRERAILDLRDQGLTVNQIAEYLGETSDEISNTLRRLRRRARSQLEGNHDE